jgi:hypothetical protein
MTDLIQHLLDFFDVRYHRQIRHRRQGIIAPHQPIVAAV